MPGLLCRTPWLVFGAFASRARRLPFAPGLPGRALLPRARALLAPASAAPHAASYLPASVGAAPGERPFRVFDALRVRGAARLGQNVEIVEQNHTELMLERMTKKQLQDRLRARGLQVSGNKPELIKRLETAPAVEAAVLNSLTVLQLKERLRSAGLKVSGRKADLVQRLFEAAMPIPSTWSQHLFAAADLEEEVMHATAVDEKEYDDEAMPRQVDNRGATQKEIARQPSGCEAAVTFGMNVSEDEESKPRIPEAYKLEASRPDANGPQVARLEAEDLEAAGLVEERQLTHDQRRDTMEQREARTAEMQPSEIARQHVLIVLNGVQGCGKSSLSKLLGRVFPGTIWLNQDEFVHLADEDNKPRELFTRALCDSMRSTASGPDALPRLILVDRMNHQERHRSDVLREAKRTRWRDSGGLVLLVEMLLGEGHVLVPRVDVLRSRIEQRGNAHKTLRPSTQDVHGILARTIEGIEPITPEERRTFDGTLSLDAAWDVVDKALYVSAELFRLGWISALEWRRWDCSGDRRPSEQILLPPGAHLLPYGSAYTGACCDWQALRVRFAAEWKELQLEEELQRKKPRPPSAIRLGRHGRLL